MKALGGAAGLILTFLVAPQAQGDEFCTACAPLRDWAASAARSELTGLAGAPEILVQSAIGAAGDDYAFDIWPTNDGYVLTGRTRDVDSDNIDAFIVRTDREGGVEWAKRWGGDALDIGFGVRTAPDGTILVVGWTTSYGAGEGDVFLLGLDPNGAAEFARLFGGPGDDRGTQLLITKEGEVVIVGETYSFGDGDARFYLVKTDIQGNPLWERTYDGGPLNERGFAVVEHDQGLLIAGSSMDSTSGSRASVSDGFVVMTGPDGKELWNRRYGGDEYDIIHHVAPIGDDRFVITGYSKSFAGGSEPDIWIVVIDEDGEALRSHAFGGEGADHNIIARTAPDGAVLLGGYTQSYGDGDWDAEIAGLSAGGDRAWSGVYRGPGNDGAVSIAPMESGVTAVAGFTESFGAGGQDILFIKVNTENRE